MKVIYIGTTDPRFSTGKQYDCIVRTPWNRLFKIDEHDILLSVYDIVDDNNIRVSLSYNRFNELFITLSEVREDKLKELGI